MDNSYTDEIETVLENVRCNCVVLHNEHRLRYLQLKGTLKYYKVPIIVISSISSIISLSQQFIDQNIITLLNMILGLICSIIGSIELFFGISNQLIKEHDTSKEFHVLAMSIFKCLTLKRIDRPENGITFLENTYSNYIKLIENSCILKTQTNDKLCDIPPLSFVEEHNMKRERGWDHDREVDLDAVGLCPTASSPLCSGLRPSHTGSTESKTLELLEFNQLRNNVLKETPRSVEVTPRIVRSPYISSKKAEIEKSEEITV